MGVLHFTLKVVGRNTELVFPRKMSRKTVP